MDPRFARMTVRNTRLAWLSRLRGDDAVAVTTEYNKKKIYNVHYKWIMVD